MIQKEKIMTYSASLSEYRAGLALYKKNLVTIERIDSFWRGEDTVSATVREKEDSRTRKAAERFTRGLRRPGPLVLLLCRFVPGGRMAAGYHAGRNQYPIKLFVAYDGGAALAWATYGGLVGHVGGTAITQSAWRLFAIAATAAVIFGTSGWVLALFGGRKEAVEAAAAQAADTAATEARAASAGAPPRRSSRTATGRS